jgi:hypothetical protein
MDSAFALSAASSDDGLQRLAIHLKPESLSSPGLTTLAPGHHDTALEPSRVDAPHPAWIHGVGRHSQTEIIDESILTQ